MRNALLFCLAVLVIAPRASAQDGGPPPEYRGIVDSALEEFDAQHWAEARALFEHAHAIFPNARTLRGVGMAAFELRDYVAARRSLEASLTETRRALTDEQRAQVTELVTRARVFVGDFRVGPAPAGTELDVDGVPTVPDGDLGTEASVALAAGAHELTLRAPDGRTAHAQVTVHGGESTALALAITDAVVATPPQPEPEPRTAPPPPPPSEGPGAGPWVLVIGGAVLAVAGAVLLGGGASDAATVSNAPPGTDWADLESPYAWATPLEISGIVALAVGVGCAAGGLAWMLTSPDATTHVAIGPGSLVVGGELLMRALLLTVALGLVGCANVHGDGYYGCARSMQCPSTAPFCGADWLCHTSASGTDAGMVDAPAIDAAGPPLTYPDCVGGVTGACGADTCYYDPALGSTTNGYCTRSCMNDSDCPAFDGATSACLAGQCARGCTGTADCPDGLSCSGGRWRDGAALRLCVSLVAAEANWYSTCQIDGDCQRPLSCVNGYCLRSCATSGDCVEFLEVCLTSAAPGGTRGCVFECSTASDCNSLDGQCNGGGCHPHPGW